MGNKIKISFSDSFQIECSQFLSYPCEQDWVEIRSNKSKLDVGNARYCCSNFPSITESTDNEMLVLFYSADKSNLNSIGFFAAYSFIGSYFKRGKFPVISISLF